MPNDRPPPGLPANAGKDTIREYINKWTRTHSNGACWCWQLQETKSGYGQLRIGGAAFAVRRIVWWLTHGYLPQGEKVSETCGEKNCHNPAHLRDRTPEADRRATLFKGGKKGFNQPRISPEQVAAVWLDLHLNGGSIAAAAKLHGVSPACLQKHLKRYENSGS